MPKKIGESKLQSLDKNAKRRFLRLVEKENSKNGNERVIGRLQMRTFIREHGEAECRAFYKAYEAKLNERQRR